VIEEPLRQLAKHDAVAKGSRLMPRRAWASGDERALQITCGGCDEETVISLMRLRMLAFLRCGCGNMLLDEDEVREYRRRLERDDPS
jgi:hypothetical protein